MPTRRRLTFYGNGILTRNTAEFPNDPTDTGYAIRELVDAGVDEYEIEQIIDPNDSGDVDALTLGGAYNINESLAELRFGPKNLAGEERRVRVTANQVQARFQGNYHTINANRHIFTGPVRFEDPVEFQSDIAVPGGTLAYRLERSSDVGYTGTVANNAFGPTLAFTTTRRGLVNTSIRAMQLDVALFNTSQIHIRLDGVSVGSSEIFTAGANNPVNVYSTNLIDAGFHTIRLYIMGAGSPDYGTLSCVAIY